MLRRSAGHGFRPAVVALVTLFAWFCLANHCVLGRSLGSSEDAPSGEPNGCPMHSAPAKKNPATKIPCCKDLRAVIAKCVSATPVTPRLLGSCDYPARLLARPTRLAIQIAGLDTGPPGLFSFAESVLQESMLSHAPPVS